MAAEAILSVFLDKVANLLVEEARSLGGVRDQVQWIEREMRQMHSFLKDAREKQFASENVRTWVADIQETAYDAEDLIDTFILQKAQQRRRSFFKRGVHADKQPHEVQLLSEQDAWMSFKHFAFKGKKHCQPHLKELGRRIVVKSKGLPLAHCPPHLEELGRHIVGKCEGLPLAIVLMGGVLCTKDESFDAWSRVFNSLSWRLNQDASQYTSILALSYYDLPVYLKQCFLYFGIFPEGFEIPVKRLIQMWIAEGFVHPRGEEELEDVGKDYTEELVDRNIIQVTYRKENVNKFIRSAEMDRKTKMSLVTMNGKSEGRSLTCSMHGFVRDLSISIAKENNFLDVYAKESHNTSYSLAKERVRRLAVHFDSEKVTSLKGSFQKLHSLLLYDIREGETQREENRNFLQRSIMVKNSFVCLKVLDLEGTYKPTLPKALGKLIHLRYLGLRRTWLNKLPSSIADLFNLQTLDLKCTEIQVIPQGIWGMKHLRHLYLNGGACGSVTTSVYASRNLWTLYGLLVGEENCVRRMLNIFTKIRKLGIEGDLISQGEELADWIASLHQLEHLKLKSTTGELKLETSRDWERPYYSLNKLHLEGKIIFFPSAPALLSGLTKLTLIGSLKESDPMRELGLLENLRILRLWYNSYVGRSMVCSSGEFPKLEILEVCWPDTLTEWVVEEGAMPNLRELEINKCNKLTKLPDGLRFLNNLTELRLPAMSHYARSRLLPYKGIDWYKIQHIPFISPPLCNDTAPATASAASTSSSFQHPFL